MVTEPASIRVLIVDDHDSVRLGLSTALAIVDDLVVVAEAASGGEALRLCGRLQPEVVLMEIALPDLDGVSVIRRIREQFPATRVVVLTTAPSTRLRRRAEAAGASGYLQKHVTVEDLIEVIRAVHAGRSTAMPPTSQEGARP